MTKHVLRILKGGDTELAEWDPANKIEIKTAAEVFGDLQKQNYHFFDAGQPGEDKAELKEFDPEAKEIVGFQPLTGG